MDFQNITCFFDVLNRSNINYLVLRNFSNFNSESFLLDDHPDIDILCDDRDEFIKVSNCVAWKGNNKKWDKTHAKINVSGRDISIDIRTVGDGYYCEKWQKDMLLSKKNESSLFFRPNDRHLFYSLIYHSIIQKPQLSDDYKRILSLLAKINDVSIKSYDRKELIKLMESYMIENKYVYTYPSDKHVPLYTNNINKKLIAGNKKLYRIIYWSKINIIQLLVHFKRCIKCKTLF